MSDGQARGAAPHPARGSDPLDPILQGLDALETMFGRAKAEGRAAFLPYFPIGYPGYAESLDAVVAMAEAGVDGFEIGMPFSDPLADGPTNQAAMQVALENGITVSQCIGAIRDLRERGIKQPMLLMGYLNPVLAYGVEKFLSDAKAAGADGFIIPDWPPEEAEDFAALCEKEGLALILFLAPTSNAARIKLVAERASGFIYVVSLVGVTGARTEIPAELTDFMGRVREATDTPLVVGFGISQPEHARRMNAIADGFIVGSALVKAAQDGVEAVRNLADSLRQALDE